MFETFDQMLLLEMNTHAILSKYFSESSKIIASAFECVAELCRNRDAFVFVLIGKRYSIEYMIYLISDA